ncbi:F-box/kelch-repeat protein At3g24760 [Asparagus officinalis]|nr:F-box/kelch-repeat protein At3g24760 [Asparagus officinalis]
MRHARRHRGYGSLVEIYDPAMDTWELGPPLPAEFRSGNSSQWICSAMMEDSLFFVFGIFSSILSAFDLRTRSWSRVEIVRPPGVSFSFLIARRDRLVLAGLCNANLVLWDVNYKSFAYKRIGEMPRDLMVCLFESEDDDAKFASLKCVGLGGLIYVFNEDHHRGYPACVCEIGDDSVCKWRKVPPLPGPVNRFHKVIAFCSGVSLHPVVADDW